jgi:glycine betaine/proline transport system ATP-binding protein
VLSSASPVRVVRDGELLGVVDDDAILRVIVAEDKTPAAVSA